MTEPMRAEWLLAGMPPELMDDRLADLFRLIARLAFNLAATPKP